MASWNSFYSYILQGVPGVPKAVARQHVREAAIEFCQKTRIWKASSDATDITEDQAEYEFNPETGSEIAGIRRVLLNGAPLAPITEVELNARYGQWEESTGTPQKYLVEEPDRIRLYPIPDADDTEALVVKVALKPSADATTCPDFLYNRYRDDIAAGARARLLKIPNKKWTGDPREDQRKFNSTINVNRSKQERSGTDGPIHVEIPFFA